MRLLNTMLAVLFCLALFSFKPLTSLENPGTAEAGLQRWRFIGDKRVNFGVDRDVIVVKGNDNYRQIKVKVTDGPLQMIDMDIYFENGDKMNVPMKNRFKQGDESRLIDLPGGSRSIRRIEFVYETIGFVKGKARVAVWGKR